MTAVSHDIEDRRLALQAALDAGKSQADRNRLGQFATPTTLAREIVAYSLGLLPRDERVRFLDPAFGTGSFYSALRVLSAAKRVASATGFEIDPHYGLPARNLWSGTPLRLSVRDFTTAEPRPRAVGRNLLICNPPYVRHHHLTTAEKRRLKATCESRSGVRVPGLSGLYTYFVALSHTWMSRHGVAAWLIPSEFMDVNYGKAVKAYLLEKVCLLRIHRFDPRDVQFDDALVSSAVVWFKKGSPPAGRHKVEFTFGGSVAEPRVRRFVESSILASEAKWTRFPIEGARTSRVGPTLGDFFRVQRGLATGGNSFFVMTQEEAETRGLPAGFLRYILPSPRYLPEAEVPADEHGRPLIEQPRLLLDCRLPEEEVRARFPSLWAYLSMGKRTVANGYLCSHRSPWYSQEDRPPAPFLCTYMGRRDATDSTSPFRFILNHSRATAANVYLMLYPRPPLSDAIAANPILARSVWNVLRSIQPRDLLDEGRVYGGGLHKVEPMELMNVPADAIRALIERADAGPADRLLDRVNSQSVAAS